MPDRYTAILRGNQLEWTGVAPAQPDRGTATPVTVIVRQRIPDSGRQMAAALERLAREDPPIEIGDPAQWERSLRQDRPLLGRDDAC